MHVLIWGAGDEQNHFNRILAAIIRQWGYAVSIPSASLLNETVSKERWDDIKADVLVCDLDDVLLSTVLPEAPSAQAFRLVANGEMQLPPTSLASLVIVLSSRSVSRSTLEQLGAVALLYKPFEMSLLHRYLVVMQQLLQDGRTVKASPVSQEARRVEGGEASIRVLVVEDDERVAETIRQCLECEPLYDVRIAKDGLEALEHCITWQPQCIVTDLLMPWMNGYQVIRSLSAGRNRYTPAFVVLSALPQRELPVHPDYLQGKEIVFVEKPFYVEQLLQAVDKALTQ